MSCKSWHTFERRTSCLCLVNMFMKTSWALDNLFTFFCEIKQRSCTASFAPEVVGSAFNAVVRSACTGLTGVISRSNARINKRSLWRNMAALFAKCLVFVIVVEIWFATGSNVIRLELPTSSRFCWVHLIEAFTTFAEWSRGPNIDESCVERVAIAIKSSDVKWVLCNLRAHKHARKI